MVDGVFEEVQGGDAVNAFDKVTSVNVIFYPAIDMGADAVLQVQAMLRKRILRALCGPGSNREC